MLHGGQTFFQEYALAMRRGCREANNQAIELRSVCLGNCGSASWVVIGHSNRNNSAFAVLGNVSILRKFFARFFFKLDGVHLLKVELLAEASLDRFTTENSHKEGARTLGT